MTLAECSICKEKKVRNDSGKLNTQGRAIWLDDQGNRWNGLVCPRCKFGVRVKDLAKMTKRRCRKCNTQLSTDRYFHCHGCSHALPDIHDDDMNYAVHRGK